MTQRGGTRIGMRRTSHPNAGISCPISGIQLNLFCWVCCIQTPGNPGEDFLLRHCSAFKWQSGGERLIQPGCWEGDQVRKVHLLDPEAYRSRVRGPVLPQRPCVIEVGSSLPPYHHSHHSHSAAPSASPLLCLHAYLTGNTENTHSPTE